MNSINEETKFSVTHGFLTRILSENAGVLTKNDLVNLRKILKRYVAFSKPDSSKYAFGKPENSNKQDEMANFQVFEMSLSNYKNMNVGNSIIWVDDSLTYGYDINLKNKKSNTLNDIIQDPDLASREFFGNSSTAPQPYTNLNAGKLCQRLKDVILPGNLNNAGIPPSKHKIVVSQDNIDVNGRTIVAKVMLVFFTNENKKRRILLIRQKQEYLAGLI
jgi:hypothetical protein